MGIEIERKYLVANDGYKKYETEVIDIRQGYLSREPERTVRIRTWNNRGYITVKGLSHGASRCEYEYEIPNLDACEMLEMCEDPILHKRRHLVEYAGHRWEVDEFLGQLSPLVTAEIELKSEAEAFELPPFIGKDVTGDPRYYNSNLMCMTKPVM